MIAYRFTDTIGTSGSILVDADTDVTTILRWYGALETRNIHILAASLGVLKPRWDEDVAAFLGIRVEVIPDHVCPECVQGKHPNCDGSAWDDDADDFTACTCPCREDEPPC